MVVRKPACVVFGGGGFIGTTLCWRLAESGHRVRAFGRRRLFPEAKAGIDRVAGDFTATAATGAAIESFDVVFHLVHAAMPRAADLDMTGDVRKNVIPKLALCRHLHGPDFQVLRIVNPYGPYQVALKS